MRRQASADPDWVSLSEASRVLGVSPATLRRWSDAGRLRVYTTPGGHRRFSRDALERPASRRPVAASVDRRRRPHAQPDRADVSPREPGARAGAAVGPDPHRRAAAPVPRARPRARREPPAAPRRDPGGGGRPPPRRGVRVGRRSTAWSPRASGCPSARRSRASSASARRSTTSSRSPPAGVGSTPSETTDLLESAERAMDRLLVATMTGHGLATGRGGLGRAVAATAAGEREA